MSWTRVTKTNKCPVCGKPDWCCVGDFFYNCMRVQSEQPCKNGGWLHPVNKHRPRVDQYAAPPPRPVINCKRLLADWSSATREEMLACFGNRLGMTTQSLRALNCCWASPYSAWAFGMRDGHGNLVGIRLRTESGAKFAVPGSHQGLFIPDNKWDKMLVVCEGPTDCCAALDLGYWAVGRPSCSGGVADLVNFVKRKGVRRCVIICDNDQAGITGSKTLSNHLTTAHCLVVLPSKDLRSFMNLGGTKQLLDSIISTSIWTVSA